MQQNKTKLSIITLIITAIVCFSVAILGMSTVKNSAPAMADTTPTTYYMISDENQPDGWKWTTAEAPAETATKVTITFKVISRTGTGRHFQMLATDGTTEKLSQLHGALTFGDAWFANGATVTLVADLTAKTYSLYNADGTKWDSTSLTFESANKFGTVVYKEYPAAVIGLYEITAVDDTGKDLGITSSSAGITITTDKVYTVTMNANNGSDASKAFVKAGATLTETTPLYDGHLFKGWFTDAECTTAYDFSQEVSSDLNLYAKWVAIDHVVARTVTFTGVEGTNYEFHVASRLPHSADATKVYIEYTLTDIDGAGHSFLFGKSVGTLAGAFSERNVWKSVRWTQVNSHIAVANNAALYSGSYTVIFDFATNSMLWYRGTTLILTGTSENKQGDDINFADAIGFGLHTYTTAGSGEMSIKIYDDMGKDLDITTYKTANNAIEYNKATYDVNYEGGENTVVDVKKATISSKDITREGYTLEGWYTDAECTTPYDFTKEVAGDITIYAKWEEIPQVVVTFNANGGADVDPQTIYVDTKATAPTSTKTGYDLVGWYSDAELTQEFDFDTVVTEDITLYAKWTIQVYEVIFNTNGGNTIDNATVEYNQTLTLPTAPTKDGYAFVGWYTDETLETEYDATSAITAGFTLYAKWIEVFTVTFDTDGGTEIEAQEVNAGSKATEPTAPVKEGFTFDGWFAEENGTEAFDFNTAIDADITLYAKWTAIPVVDEDPADTEEPTFIDKVVSKVTSTFGCAGSLAQDSFMIIGTMLAVAGVIVIKALKKKEN
ncbi:MAG: hypothetical protein E7348_04325 [Clostridiales bacterium]|nr:hypothetical protein [Clostridiales bacterium]